MRLRVLLFAGLADGAGGGELTVEIPEGATVAELRAAAEQAVPRLRGQVYRVAVDAAYASAGDRVDAAAEVAFLPPVSGG